MLKMKTVSHFKCTSYFNMLKNETKYANNTKHDLLSVCCSLLFVFQYEQYTNNNEQSQTMRRKNGGKDVT